MKGQRFRGRLLLTCVLATFTCSLGGLAYAHWSASGSGAGSGTTGTNLAVTLSPGTPAANLYPGGSADVVLSVSNSNPSPVYIGSLALDTSQGTGGYDVDAGHPGCVVTTLSFTTQTNGGAGWTVPAKVGAVNGALPVTLSDALAMGADAANACQGASSTVYLAADP